MNRPAKSFFIWLMENGDPGEDEIAEVIDLVILILLRRSSTSIEAINPSSDFTAYPFPAYQFPRTLPPPLPGRGSFDSCFCFFNFSFLSSLPPLSLFLGAP